MELTYNFVGENLDTAASSSNHLLENTNDGNKRTIIGILEEIKPGGVKTEPISNEKLYMQPGWLLKISGQDWKHSLLLDKLLPTKCNLSKPSETRNVRLLPREDIMLYGEIPKVDNKVLVKCDKCERVLMPSGCKLHFKDNCEVSTSNKMPSKDLNVTKKTKKTIAAKPLPPVPLFAEKVIPLHLLDELVLSPEALASLSNLNNQRLTKENGIERNDNLSKSISEKLDWIINLEKPLKSENHHNIGSSKLEVEANKFDEIPGGKEDNKTDDENMLSNINHGPERAVAGVSEGLNTESVENEFASNEKLYMQPGWLLKMSGKDWKQSLLLDKVLPTKRDSPKPYESRKVRLLPREDIMLYGEIPKVENKVLVKCDKCERVLMPSSCKTHYKDKCKLSTFNMMLSKDLNLTKKTKKIIAAKSLPPVPLFTEVIPLHLLDGLVLSPEALASLSSLKNQRIAKEHGIRRNNNPIRIIEKLEEIINLQGPNEKENHHNISSSKLEVGGKLNDILIQSKEFIFDKNKMERSAEELIIEKLNKVIDEIMQNVSRVIPIAPKYIKKVFLIKLDENEKVTKKPRNTNKNYGLKRKRERNGLSHQSANHIDNSSPRSELQMAVPQKRSYFLDLSLAHNDPADRFILNLTIERENDATVRCNFCHEIFSKTDFQLHLGNLKHCKEGRGNETLNDENEYMGEPTVEMLPPPSITYNHHILPPFRSCPSKNLQEVIKAGCFNLQEDVHNKKSSSGSPLNEFISVQIDVLLRPKPRFENLSPNTPNVLINSNSISPLKLFKPMANQGSCITKTYTKKEVKFVAKLHRNVLKTSACDNINKINMKRTSTKRSLFKGDSKYAKLKNDINAFGARAEVSDSVDLM